MTIRWVPKMSIFDHDYNKYVAYGIPVNLIAGVVGAGIAKTAYEKWPPLYCTKCNSMHNPQPTYVTPTHRAIFMLEDDSDSICIEYLCRDCSNDCSHL